MTIEQIEELRRRIDEMRARIVVGDENSAGQGGGGGTDEEGYVS